MGNKLPAAAAKKAWPKQAPKSWRGKVKADPHHIHIHIHHLVMDHSPREYHMLMSQS